MTTCHSEERSDEESEVRLFHPSPDSTLQSESIMPRLHPGTTAHENGHHPVTPSPSREGRGI
ncbi:MAG: hypothetical protein J4O03_04150, partial [Chloroflexi bacterium]|nr:hypothetical protein [Chloroflexota bacterium]